MTTIMTPKGRIMRPVRVRERAYPAKTHVLDIRDERHPVRKEISRMCRTFQLTATFSLDEDTLRAFSHVQGFIPVLCVLKKDGQVIGLGRGCSTLSRLNKSVERSVLSAVNGSLLSAVNNACKVLDSLRLEETKSTPNPIGEAYRVAEAETGGESATEKQLDYLRQLIQVNCEEDDRERWMSQLGELTKQEASEAIERFTR